MHLTPGMRRIMNKAQVKLVCASGVIKFGIPRTLSLLEERYLAVDTDSSNKGWYRTIQEVLH
jgi:hypothetical protein